MTSGDKANDTPPFPVYLWIFLTQKFARCGKVGTHLIEETHKGWLQMGHQNTMIR